MKVAWDLQAVTGPKPTGLGVSVRFLLEAWLAHAPGAEASGLRPNEEDRALIGVPDRLRWEQGRLPLALRRARAQGARVAYSPALGAPLIRPLPQVAHVHDLIPLHADSQFSGAAGWYWRTLLPYSWKRCNLLTVSNHTVADEIARRLAYPRGRIHVVPYYADPQVATVAAQLKPGYAQISADDAPGTPVFVTLASHEPRKNLDKAILALAVLKAEGITARLKLIGGHTPLTDGLRRLAEDYGVAGQVELPGYMGRGDAVRELLECTALLFISREEGYGMPPQEAQSIGVATVLSDIPCLRAVYADEERIAQLPPQLQLTPAFVPVDDPTQLALEMKRLIEDGKYRQRLRQAGLHYSATFSPQATALALASAFKAALVG